jgi:hypothetical protein
MKGVQWVILFYKSLEMLHFPSSIKKQINVFPSTAHKVTYVVGMELERHSLLPLDVSSQLQAPAT